MAQKKRVLALVGGISRDSLNIKLFTAIRTQMKTSFNFHFFDISVLPFFSQDLENDPPEIVEEFWQEIKKSDGVLFITPEYNRSYPGVLKNAIDWGSRPADKNKWKGLPAGVMGASVGAIGTFGAQQHLRQVLNYLDMRVMGQPEFYLNASKAFDDKGKLIDEKTKNFLTKYFQAYKLWLSEH